MVAVFNRLPLGIDASMNASSPRDDLLRLRDVYLNDHWAGAAAGSALAARLAKENVKSPWGTDLASISDQIRADKKTLAEIRRQLHSNGGAMKKAVALVGERVTRLKPNGRLHRYSPLSRVLELEALISGVSAKQRLWVALQTMDQSAELLAAFDLQGLEDRANSQLDLLRSIHVAASGVAFGGICRSG